ncbi:hypothetical protein [Corynebacterium suedekumii]|uniref:Antitoxin HicB n=1 Tax=Corynebacterium suedekumii TaxID=3049801 RepID=A0ABY8VMP1_9CORY|nr:hypothetical protein [Corynebacterium suedekumii]WIM70357.1 hypothetical protein QP029_00315 [Corynebacterium suedekumii]
MSTRVEAVVHRQGQWWEVEIPSLGQVTQARTMSAVEAAIAEVAHLVTGQPISCFDIVMDIRVDGIRSIAQRAAEIRSKRERAHELEREAQEATRALAVELRNAGVSGRDAAEFLGVSHQRIHQLTS